MQILFKSKKGNTVTIVIDSDWTDTYSLGSTPVTLEEDNDEDFFLPVRTWSGYIHFVDVTAAFAMHLAERRRKVTISVAGVLVWQGWTKQESYGGELRREFDYDLPIECALSGAKYIDVVQGAYGEYVTGARLLSEALDAAFGENSYTLHLEGTVRDPETKVVWYAGWNPTEGHAEDVKSYFDMMEDLMRASGMVMYVRGTDVWCVKPEAEASGAVEAEALATVLMVGGDNTWSIGRPKKKVILSGGAPDAEFPQLSVNSIDGEDYDGTSAFDAGDDKIYAGTFVPSNNELVKHQKDGANVSSLPYSYFVSKNFVGGGTLTTERTVAKDDPYSTSSSVRSIVISRHMNEPKGTHGILSLTMPMVEWKPERPIHVSPGKYQIRGSVRGMSEMYKWEHDCAGYLLAVIRVGNVYLTHQGGSYIWSGTGMYVSIPMGSTRDLKAHDGVMGMVGAQEDGFIFNVGNMGEMEVKILGFIPKDDDVLFCKINDLTIAPTEVNDGGNNSHTLKASDDGLDTYDVSLHTMARTKKGRSYGYRYDSGMGWMESTLLRTYKEHFSKPEITTKMRVDDSVAHGVHDRWTWDGNTLRVRNLELDLKEDEVVMYLASV